MRPSPFPGQFQGLSPGVLLRVFPGLLLICALAAQAADSPRRLDAELLWQIERIGAPVISPDGARVVVPVTSYEMDSDESETRLWLLSSSDDALQRPLTAAGQSASSPVFSPDGARLAFVAKRSDDEVGQIYLLPMDVPGEAERLTELPTGVSAVKWVDEHLYFISSVWPGKSFDEMAEALKAEKDSKVSAKAWGAMPVSFFDRFLDAERQNHLFRIPAAGGEIERLTEATGRMLNPGSAGSGDYDVSPDGRLLAFVADAAADGIDPDPDLFLLEIGATEPVNLTRGNKAPDFAPLFSPDGSMLAFIRQHIPGFYADQHKLMIHELGTGRTRLVLDDWDRSADGLVWSPDSAGLFGAIDDAGTRRVYFLPLSGGDPVAITGATDFDSIAIGGDGTLVARDQSFLYPPRIVRIEPESGQTRRLENFNDALLAEVELGSYESVTYPGADGAEIQMWVHYPPGFDRDSKYPLFLLIHGGPHGAITDTFHFRWNAQTFASWGYVTAWHNFHGSTGFGQDFADAINPDWVSKPYADTIAAAEWLAGQPWIDAERMVAGGGSYGGYLSSILLGREHPFNALVIHAAVYDLYAQTAADFAVHEQRFGAYWENPEIYRAISPHYQAGKFDTPSLILHGQRDLRVPVGQAFSMFRALQRRGVESRLVYYPDENHWVLKPNNSLNWYGEVRDWIARHAAPGPIEADAVP